MANPTLNIWCNASFPPELSERIESAVAPNSLIWSANLHSSNLASAERDLAARSADIIFGQPNPEDLMHAMNLKWIHLTTAGYTRYDNDHVRAALKAQGTVLTNSSEVFADSCAEHLLAFMLCEARTLPPLIVNDATAHQWMYTQTRNASTLLRGQSAVLVGFGAIGRRLVELLTPFQMQLSAVRRSVRGNESIRTFTSAQIDEAIANVDHVINILPAAPGTAGVFNAARFARMKPGTLFYNVGRGDTVDQDALCDALESGHIKAAYLDVTTPEPLPPDHRLWKAPNCWITPHIAGGHKEEARANAEHFLRNLQRFLNGDELVDRVM